MLHFEAIQNILFRIFLVACHAAAKARTLATITVLMWCSDDLPKRQQLKGLLVISPPQEELHAQYV